MPDIATPMRINKATTAQAAAELLVAPTTAGRKPLVVQAMPSQTGNLLELQSSTGSLLSFFLSSGNLRLGTPLGGVQPSTSLAICAPYADRNTWPNLAVVSNDAQAADKGGTLSLCGVYDDAGGTSPFVRFAAGKDNGTSGDTGAYLSIACRPAGASMTERLRITSTGSLELRNGTTVNVAIDNTGTFSTPVKLGEGVNVVTGTTTGTKFGTTNLQKLGWWNAAPVIQNAGWTVTAGYTADRSFNPASTTLNETAAVLGTLIDTLKSYGLLAA
jgi:hypothetical protein